MRKHVLAVGAALEAVVIKTRLTLMRKGYSKAFWKKRSTKTAIYAISIPAMVVALHIAEAMEVVGVAVAEAVAVI
ncbi:hypothetical protein NAF17_04665 [Mucilaginibacter sp. RB4R14]|uniref:hypothetical protein n=1 Tax=Mucilaginibacter aurantiaciroseus TaxID=2949308 RepID=UPI002091080A|nr:hypothetical protein [Mucilaginibacter aurantiaciroseus]MCO5934822.1 hypothetical protein [Mucilaginibacter aurantiaciroseus]